MTKRRGLAKKTRFEVFKRDRFTCLYCGTRAPDAILVVDHLRPVADGGDNSIQNLVTACQPCNAGKADRRLDDSTELDVQHARLAELQAQREQLEMMLNWRLELDSIENQAVARVADYINSKMPGWSLNASGVSGISKLLKKYGLSDTLEGIGNAATYYIKIDPKTERATKESSALFCKKYPAVVAMVPEKREHPDLDDLFYIRGIIKNRTSRAWWNCMRDFRRLRERGWSVADIKSAAMEIQDDRHYELWIKDAMVVS